MATQQRAGAGREQPPASRRAPSTRRRAQPEQTGGTSQAEQQFCFDRAKVNFCWLFFTRSNVWGSA
eukprot:scaffold10057_cov140-Isochrysis_galbana.AAC.4